MALVLLVLSLLTSSPAISALDPGLEAAPPPSRLTSLMADTGLSPNTSASAVASSWPHWEKRMHQMGPKWGEDTSWAN